MKTYKLKNHKYANAYIEENNFGFTLYSYSTPVLTLFKTGWLNCTFDEWLDIMNGYSRTTASHIRYFIEQYHLNIAYSFCKELYKTDTLYNVNTGEIIPRKTMDLYAVFGD